MIDDIVIGTMTRTITSETQSQSQVEAEKEEAKSKVIPLSEVRSLIGQPLKVSLPGGVIPPEGITAIRQYLSYEGCYPYPPLEPNPEEFEWVWLTKRGTLPKRLGKWMKKRSSTGSYPQDYILAEVGAICKRYTSDNSEEFYLEVTDKIDWSSTQMGQAFNGSCWWTSGASNRIGVEMPDSNSYCEKFLSEGNLVVKFFSGDTPDLRVSSKGIGRIFLAIEPEEKEWALLFNGYWKGQGATLKLTRVFSSFLGLSYKTTYINKEDRYYVNNSKGYYLASPSILTRFPLASEDNKVIIPRIVPMFTCCGCGERKELLIDTRSSLGHPRIQDLDPSGVPINSLYCSPCWEAKYTQCLNCGEWDNSTTFQSVLKLLRPLQSFSKSYLKIALLSHRNYLATSVSICCSTCSSISTRECRECGLVWLADSRFNLEQDLCGICSVLLSKRCKGKDCLRYTVNRDAEGNPFCDFCENELEEEIRIDTMIISEETDEIIYPCPPPSLSDTEDPYSLSSVLCSCASCVASRELSGEEED